MEIIASADDVEELHSLRGWLDEDPGLARSVRTVHGEAPSGTLSGGLPVLLQLALAPGMAAGVAMVITTWIRNRKRSVTVSLKRANGEEFTLTAETVRGMDAARLEQLVGELAGWMGSQDATPAVTQADDSAPR
ncbi:hypothetical protein ACFQVD_07470 [Streptosporangium amethystogenes subsp. fukuiense]|uniref:Uncharacterized protein n=1 Tax=Streptosporangium amethystogenes subsp. fukuiense TaxID=698418 RepID=A0ABW2SV23_9ACTN